MNLARLRVFEVVARLGTFAGAADALSFTPSAISQQMARLEAEVGVVLVERSSRGVQLTAAGEVLLARAERILAEVRDAEAELTSLLGVRSVRLRLGSFPTATQGFTAHALRTYRRRHIGVDVLLRDGEPHELAKLLADRELDPAVVFAWPGRPIGIDYRSRLVCAEDAIETTPLFDDPYVAVLSDRHRLEGSEDVRLEELADEILVGSRQTPGHDQVIAHFARGGAAPLFTGHALPDYQSVRALAAAGDGIALIPRMATLVAYPGTVTVPITGFTPIRSVMLARPAGAVTSAAAGAMAALLEETVADLGLDAAEDARRGPAAGPLTFSGAGAPAPAPRPRRPP